MNTGFKISYPINDAITSTKKVELKMLYDVINQSITCELVMCKSTLSNKREC